jgi:hypothetical protein
VPATCPNSEPTRFSLYSHALVHEDPYLYHPQIYAWVAKWSLSLGFHIKALYTPLLSSVRATFPAISFFSISSPKEYWVSRKDYSAPQYAASLTSPVTSSLLEQIFPPHPILKHTQPSFLPQYQRPSSTPIKHNRQNYSSVYLNI